ncbi:MAG: hypothetical protein E7639_04075 [Ruminococcaceae bacterium]|nr:hypothetical protein [Oscillospiraceae bacterium]
MSLTGVTYAWFSAGTEATVSQINVGVKTSDGGVLISTDAEAWTSNLQSSALGIDSTALSPVSTNGAVANQALKFFTATNGDTGNITDITLAESATGNYIKFDLYFNNEAGAAKNIGLSANTLVNLPADATKHSDYAARIAIIKQSTVTTSAFYADGGLTTLQANNGTASYVYEPNATLHTAAGMRDYKAQDSTYDNSEKKFSYFGVGAAPETDTTQVNKYTDSNYLDAVTTYDLGTTAFELDADSFVKITVYIWLEGQDHDCQNDIAGQAFNVNLEFTVIAG